MEEQQKSQFLSALYKITKRSTITNPKISRKIKNHNKLQTSHLPKKNKSDQKKKTHLQIKKITPPNEKTTEYLLPFRRWFGNTFSPPPDSPPGTRHPNRNFPAVLPPPATVRGDSSRPRTPPPPPGSGLATASPCALRRPAPNFSLFCKYIVSRWVSLYSLTLS